MKYSKSIFFKCFVVMLVIGFTVYSSNVFAFESLESWVSPNGNSIARVDNIAGKIWGAIRVVLQIGAFAGIIFAGIRYMFASADTRADIKKSMTTLIIGMTIVFGATTLIDIIMRIVKEAL